MKVTWSQIPALLKKAASDWSTDKASRLAAALAYYTIFSLAPLLIIAIAVAGSVFGEEAARGQIFLQMRDLVGTQGAEAIESMVQNASKPGTGGTVATIFGVLLLIFGASGVFASLQDALNTIWEVTPKPGLGIWATIRSRLFSFGMVLGFGFLLMSSLVASAALTAASNVLGGYLFQNELFLQAINFILSFAAITLMFAVLYKYLPDVRIRWEYVWMGAMVTALLFVIGKTLIGLYIGKSSMASAYGAAGSLVVLLVWLYYSAQIFLFGAEFTQVYADACGSRKKPSENAVRLTEAQKANEGAPTVAQIQEAANPPPPPPPVASPKPLVIPQPVSPPKSGLGQAWGIARRAWTYYSQARKQLKKERQNWEKQHSSHV